MYLTTPGYYASARAIRYHQQRLSTTYQVFEQRENFLQFVGVTALTVANP